MGRPAQSTLWHDSVINFIIWRRFNIKIQVICLSSSISSLQSHPSHLSKHYSSIPAMPYHQSQHLPILVPNSVLPWLPSAVDPTIIAQAVMILNTIYWIIIIIPTSLSHAIIIFIIQPLLSIPAFHLHPHIICMLKLKRYYRLFGHQACFFVRWEEIICLPAKPRGPYPFQAGMGRPALSSSWWGSSHQLHPSLTQVWYPVSGNVSLL